MLTQDQVNKFNEQGFLVLPEVADTETVAAIRAMTFSHLSAKQDPIELESEVNYPGAPKSVDEPGGATARRLLMAYERDAVFSDWAKHEVVTQSVQQLLNTEQLWLTPNHHNTVMTKHPKFSSDTLWHRDTRYWHYSCLLYTSPSPRDRG